MGNKSSADGNRRHSIDGVLSDDDFVSDKKKSDKKKQISAKKSTSMYAKNPDDWIDGGVTKPADVKIYRSTSTGEDIQRRHRQNDGPDVRVYRRSAVGPTFANEGNGDAEPSKTRHSSSTLPRNFGRKTITVIDGRTMKDGDVANDSQLSARSAAGMRSPNDPVYSSIQRPGSRTSIRVGNGQLSAAAAAGVTLSDFPDTESVKRRLCQFENRFVERFTALYSALPETVQLSALSIAVRRRSSHPAAYYGDMNDHVISLWHYLRPPSHSDLIDHDLPPEEFALTIHPDLFHRLQLYRIEATTNNAAVTGNEGCSLTDLVRELVWSIAAEAAITISTAFEYQIGLLGDGLPCQLLADRAADCTIDFLKKTNRHLDVNALASGVIRGRPADVRVATVSVVIGQKELKWNIDEILYRPGLRKDTLLTAVDANDVRRRYSTPWRFYTSTVPGADEFVDPTIYGFRGQLLHRDFEAVETLRSGTSQPFYRVDADEEHLYNVEVMWRPEDFHRLYIPYRRFVGMALLDAYTASTAQDVWNSTGLVGFIQKLTQSVDAGQYRGDIEPVVRPLSVQREEQLQLQRPTTNGIRPRCVSDAEEFSRQQTFRQTWCPGGTVAAAAAARHYQNTAANDYRPLASPAVAAAADPVASSPYPQSTLHNKPLTIDSAYSTASTTAGVIVIDRPTSPPLAPLNTSGFYRDSPVPQTAPVLGSNPFNSSRNQPDLLPVRTVVDGNDNFVTSSSGPNSVVRRSVVSNSSASTEQPTPSSPQNDSGNNTPSKSNYFPSIDQLFGKQLRAMKSKTIHVTEFPVEESDVASKDNGVGQSAGGSVEVKLAEKDLAMSSNSPATANSDCVFFEDRQQNGAVRTSVTSPTPVTAAGVVTFRKPPPPVKPRTKSLLSSPDVTNVNRQSFGNDVTLSNDVSSTMSGFHSPTAAAVRTNGYDITTVTEVETSSSGPKSLMISDI